MFTYTPEQRAFADFVSDPDFDMSLLTLDSSFTGSLA